MKVKDFSGLFEVGLRYAYDCEQKLVKKGIPSMIEAAGTPELQTALEQHLEETRNHIKRLESIFNILGVDPDTEDNNIIDEMMDAAKEITSATEAGSPIRDAGLIVAGNNVEHYEMAVYGSLAAFARQLKLQEAVQLLQQTLAEEKAADAKLSQIGEQIVNPHANRQLKAA